MAYELLRVLKPWGVFAGSFNLFEKATPSEPQTLTYEIIDELFLKHLRDVNIRMALKSIPTYANFYENKLITKLDTSQPSILWVCGINVK